MPNWVCNEIVFESKEAAAVVREAVETDEEGFDFNKITPMPESLLVCSGSSTNFALGYLNGKISDEEASAKLPMHGRNQFGGDADITTLSQLREFGELLADNIERYGCADWYEWSIRNWGTKWNACEAYWSDTSVCFDTAWDAPIPIFAAMALRFPGVGFAATWSEEQFDLITGVLVVTSDGRCMLREPEADTYEAFVLACSFWDQDQQEHRWDRVESCISRCYEEDDKEKARFDSLPIIDIEAEARKIIYSMKNAINSRPTL